jgi:DNA modification methylase
MGKVIQGDCLEKLKQLEASSVDTIITDPPYGLSFMGKKWDYDVPQEDVWQECLRVLKPGGTALIFAGSRTYHRMAVRVEDAGFILKDCIMWLYGSGFPKATDISKQLDKRNGRYFDQGLKDYLNSQRKVKGLSLNDINTRLNVATNGGGVASAIMGDKPNNELPTQEIYNSFDALIAKAEAEREIVGKQKTKDFDNHKGSMMGKETTENGETQTAEIDITKPKTPEAKLWDGWKSHGLKPAYEPIIVAMKPNDGTYANNALKHGVSGLNIDGGRIECLEKLSRPTMQNIKGGNYNANKDLEVIKIERPEPQGRFPANIILDEEVAKDEEWKRYFYCAKASKSERGENNNHPTVKSLKLMEYLCKLTKTPTGGIVLDPFAGSGTTGLACQNTGRDYILIEREQEYVDIINERLK